MKRILVVEDKTKQQLLQELEASETERRWVEEAMGE